MLKFGVNLMHKFYSGKWLESPDFSSIPENIKKVSNKLCGTDIFTNVFHFPDKWICSIFPNISFRPVSPLKTYYKSDEIKENELHYPYKEQGKNENDDAIAKQIQHLHEELAEKPDALLMLLEKYGSFVPLSESKPISLYEHIKFLEAISQCDDSYLLASADFSGIQKFIYTISSKGALKSLRARSFLLALLSEHIIYEILKNQNLSRSSVIFSGGGSFFLILPAGARTILEKIKEEINAYFLHDFAGRLFLGLVWLECRIDDLSPPNFRNKWVEIGKLLEEDKYKKFADNLQDLLVVTMPKQLSNQDECQICHRDDCDDMEEIPDNSGQMKVCRLCKELWYLGDALTDYKYVNRWESSPPEHSLEIPALNDHVYYWVANKTEGTFHWIKNSFKPCDCWPFFSADFVTVDGKNTADFEHLAKKSMGKELIGCLRMDMDNIGAIFSERIHSNLFSPLTLSAFSKTLNLFFTIYMNIMCKKQVHDPLLIPAQNRLAERPVTIIYSGGDDLMIVGAWNEICELAIDIRRNFKRYIGGDGDISISGGVFLAHHKFPFYQMANFSGKAEEIAKRNHSECIKDSCCASYQDCYFYEPGLIPICKRKDSALLFFSTLRESKRGKLKRDPKAKDRIKTALKWDVIECKVVEPLETMYPIFTQDGNENLSRSLIYKLFSFVDKWEHDGILYLPFVAWTIERLKKMATPKVCGQINKLSAVVFNPEYMSSFYIPLTWLDLLKREEAK